MFRYNASVSRLTFVVWGIYAPLSGNVAGITEFWGIYTPLSGYMTGMTGF
ncbi:hypothetical protein HGO21_09290 [Acinetobacter sp. CUI P1]|nr:hypothetical protein [Acinetobacter sp. CUI P1]